MELVLGTAQFGLDYGITNPSGKVLPGEINEILTYALGEGINKLDTAQAYGDSELVVGDYPFFDVMTKLVVNEADWSSQKDINVSQYIKGSLRRLNRSSVYSVLIHNAEALSLKTIVQSLQALEELKRTGFIQKVGVSLYTPEKLEEITANFSIDIIQAPVNVFDQRFCTPKIKSLIKEYGIDLYARSIFLQGSLLAPETPKKLMEWDSCFKYYRQYCAETNLSRISCCLNFLSTLDFVRGIVVGVTKRSELKEIVDEFRMPMRKLDYGLLASKEDRLINPSIWQC